MTDDDPVAASRGRRVSDFVIALCVTLVSHARNGGRASPACQRSIDPAIDKKCVDMLGDVLCCIVYDKNDLTREDLVNAQVFIHGKESEPKVVQIGPRVFLACGKLTGAAEQTCALVDTVRITSPSELAAL